MRSEGVGQAQHRGELRPEQAGSKNPQRNIGIGSRNSLYHLPRLGRAEQRLEFQYILRKTIGTLGVASQGSPGALVRPRRAAGRLAAEGKRSAALSLSLAG